MAPHVALSPVGRGGSSSSSSSSMRNILAADDVTCLEILCLCNPCYEDSDDDDDDDRSLDGALYLNTLVSDEDDPTDDVPLQSPTSASRSTAVVALPANEEEDPAMIAYYTSYNRRPFSHLNSSDSKILAPVTSDGYELLLAEARRTLGSEGSETSTTPRDKSRSLERFETAIHSERNLTKKRLMILEYEVFKFDHDCANPDDQDQATMFVEHAESTTLSRAQRIEYYQYAITYTNAIQDKLRLKLRYRHYWHESMQQ